MTLLLSLVLLLSPQLTGPQTPLRAGDRIAFFGDSITWQGGYLDVLSQRLSENPHTKGLQISLLKRGINGGKSNDLRDGNASQLPFAEILRSEKPAAAVIEIGINDVWHGANGNSAAVYEKCLRDMVASANALKVPVVLATPSVIGEKPRGSNPLDAQLDQYAEVVKAVGSDTGSTVVDLRAAFFRDQRVPLTYDGVHMLPAGNLVLADELERGIALALARNPRPKVAAVAKKIGLLPWPKSVVYGKGNLTLGGPWISPSTPELELIARVLAEEIELKTGVKVLALGPTEVFGSSVDRHNDERQRGTGGGFPPRDNLPTSQRFQEPHQDRIFNSSASSSVTSRSRGEDPPPVPRGTSVDYSPGNSKGAFTQVRLRLAPTGGPERYRIEIDNDVTITASTVKGIAFGTTTLLQALTVAGGRLQVPKMVIEDEPARGYRGLMVDVARKFHSIEVLKQCVQLCRLYKLNYLQLHLTDDQSFTFPSRAYPALNSPGTTYSLQELKDLVKFAEARGVTIIPEFDIPGHSAVLVRTYPDLFKIKGTQPYEHHATINFANPAVLKAVETLIGEMCEVFGSSPYFHMGGDEADIANTHSHPDFIAAFKEFGLPEKSQQEIFRRFLTQVNEIVKKRGKQLMVWEGFGRDPNSKFPIPKDVVVMEFENAYYAPTELLEDGYSVINASWTPLYVVNRHVWPAQKVYEWDLGRFGRFSNLYGTTGWFRAPDVTRIQGAQICSWEGPEESEIENLRRVVPAMAERVWNPSQTDFVEFEPRLRETEKLLDALV
ncbi:MAG: family 20 glycosylhydrolase, partial [Fimbriimonadaceae bacterium]